jgi:signal transduction histidine kinase
MLLADRLSILEIFSLFFFLLFVHELTRKPLGLFAKFTLSIPFLPILILLFSNHNVYLVDAENCQNQSGNLYYYVYALALIYVFLAIKTLLKKYYRGSDEKLKKQIKIVMFAIIFLVVWFLSFVSFMQYLVSINYANSDNIALFIPIGMLVFIAAITYAITRYQMLNIKLLAAQVLVISLFILIGAQFFFVRNSVNIILTGITLAGVVGFGYILVRSVKLEVQRKEELENLSNQLSVANDKLHVLDQAKSEFISIASHQLRTPLTSIKGFVSLLLEGTYGALDDVKKAALEKVYISNERLIQLVEDLLNISRIEAGRMEFDFQEGQVEDLVKEVVSTLELSAKAKDLYLNYQKPEEPMPKIKMDITKIKEVISNMVDNAIKYTQKGGITVRITDHLTPKEEGGFGKVVEVIVSDTGIGMDEEELGMIFEKFQRGKQISHYHTDGTGLGMYIGKKVVDVHKGRIWAESDGHGKGSRFILELPIN